MTSELSDAMPAGDPGLHSRIVADRTFQEWLLSDRPVAAAVRARRRHPTCTREMHEVAYIRVWGDGIHGEPDLDWKGGTRAAKTFRSLAATITPLAKRRSERARHPAKPAQAYVNRLRRDWRQHGIRLPLPRPPNRPVRCQLRAASPSSGRTQSRSGGRMTTHPVSARPLTSRLPVAGEVSLPAGAAKQLYRVKEAMHVLGLTRSVIYEQLRAGRLRSVKVGRIRLIPVDAITDFVELLKREAEETT